MINLTNTDAKYEDLQKISIHCPNLKSLNLTNCAFFNLSNLTFPELKELNLTKSLIKPELLVKILLTVAPKLETLNLTNTLMDDTFDFGALAKQCPNLKVLILNSNPNLSSKGLKDLGSQELPKLSTLYFNNSERINPKDIVAFASQHPELTHLTLTASNFKDENLAKLASVCPALEELKLFDCKNINGDALKTVVDNCPQLQILHLPKAQIDDISITSLSSLKNIKSLSLAFCENITKKSLWILFEMKNLEKLDLLGMNLSLTNDDIKQLTTNLPHLKKILLPDGSSYPEE